MSFSLVGSLGTEIAGGTDAAVTPAYGQSPTALDLLVLWCIGVGGNTLPTTPSGWSVAAQLGTSASGCSSTIFYKVAAGGDAQPTIAAVSSVAWAVQLGEFSGGATASPLDQSGTAGTSGSSGTSATVTSAAADAAAGELVILTANAAYTTSATRTQTNTPNNGISWNTAFSNSGSSAVSLRQFLWGITTSNSAADDDAWSTSTGTHLSGANLALASFKLAAVPLVPQVVSQAVNRSLTY